MMSLLGALGRYYRLGVDALKEAFIRVLMGILIFLGYVLLSLFIYAIMRRIMVPQKLHVKPVHLYFNPECQIERVSTSCPFPQAEFLLSGGKKLLSSGHYYTVALELELPESPVNEEIGVFMINITFYTTGNRFLSTSARPAMLHYKSPLLHTMSTFLYSFLLLTGLSEQKQSLTLPLYENYYEPYGDGSISATVSILNHRIQLYSAVLTIDANFSGFTYYLYQWPVSMSVIVVVSIFITLCTCTVIMWVRDVLRDYDIQRRRGMQRRRFMLQQQQRQTPPNPVEIVAPPPGRVTPPSSEASVDTLTGVQEIRAVRQPGSGSVSDEEQQTPLVTPTPTTPEESYADTESEVSSTGLSEMLSSLQALRRDLEQGREDGFATDTGSVNGSSQSAESEGVRHRTGHS